MKDFNEIVEKRKATMIKKKDFKFAKQEANIKSIDKNLEYLLKRKSAVQKRIDTLTKKNFVKYSMKAYEIYTQEKNKGRVAPRTEKLRKRKPGEKGKLYVCSKQYHFMIT